MERLTKHYKEHFELDTTATGSANIKADNPLQLAVYDITVLCSKLGQLEDIEEELGISLETLFKAQTQGFCVKTACGVYPVRLSDFRFNLKKKEIARIQWNNHYLFEDYGKTWALTKEELENGRENK